MNKIFYKIFILIITASFLFPFITSAETLDSCVWREVSASYHPETGQLISESGGCLNGETEINSLSKEAEEKCGPRPAGRYGGTHECCCAAVIENAETVKENGPLFKAPDIKIEIPGMEKLSDIQCVEGEACYIPWLGQYIKGFYNYAIAIAGILAAIMLMAGGVLWLLSRGDASQIGKAKNLIIGSISGMIILAASYIILTIINPELVNLQSIKIVSIKEIKIAANGSDSNENITTTYCKNINDDLKPINDIVSTNASRPQLVADAYTGLKKAVEIAQREGISLYVTSALRTYDDQKALYDKAKEIYGAEVNKYVADPKYCKDQCYGHCSGRAIDVCIKGTTSCTKMGAGTATNATYSDSDVEKLKQIMKEAGWIRYCGEWWHFQYGLNPGKSCSP